MGGQFWSQSQYFAQVTFVREPGAWAGPASQQGPGQVSAAQRHGQVQRGQGVHVTLVQGEVILETDMMSDLT